MLDWHQRLGGLHKAVRGDMVLPRLLFPFMHLLYLDDSGSPKNQDERYFILAGIAVFERQAYWLQKALDDLAESLGHPEPNRLEFHGNQIQAGRNWWRRMHIRQRRAILRQALETAQSLAPEHWRLFGVVVDKSALSPEDPVGYAFEQLCNRFDRFLSRLYHQGHNQKGLIVLDKSAEETRLQSLASDFRTIGHRWGVTRNLVDVPFFVDSKATRFIQYADLVAYAMRRKFELGDAEFFDLIEPYFDREGGVVHGLHHYRNRDESCDCPSCRYHSGFPLTRE